MENKSFSKQMADFMNGLTDEQKEKVTACKSADELAACLSEMGVALPDELLDPVAGGVWPRVRHMDPVMNDGTPDQVSGSGLGLGQKGVCPVCRSTKKHIMKGNDCVCPDCGYLYFSKSAHLGIF